ncbi:MAG: hypothetical protein J6J36_09000 [Clostridia bacterium]|nr:hypothetical protein [Clostridia bacterium]
MEKYLNEIRSYDSSNGCSQLNMTSIIRNMIIECRYNHIENEKVTNFIDENLVEIIEKLTAEEIKIFSLMYLKNAEFSKSPANLLKLYTNINRRIESEIESGNKINKEMGEAIEQIIQRMPNVCQTPDYFEDKFRILFDCVALPVKISAYKALKGKDEAFDDEMRAEILTNLKLYLDYQDESSLLDIMKTLTSDELFDGLLEEDIYTFVDQFKTIQTMAMEGKKTENMETTSKICEYLDMYFNSYINRINGDESQIKDLIDESEPPLSFMIIDNYKDTSSTELRDFMNDKLESFKNCYASWLLQKFKYSNSMYDSNIYEENYIVQNYEVVRTMLDELLKSENQRLIDIKQIGQGGSSRVYQIKDKVIKIGEKRVNPRIPMHRRLIQPLVRLELDDVCIEVQDRVEIRDDIEKEDLYPIFCEMLDEGIIWGDSKCENVGVLLKDNEATLNGEVISVSPDAVNYDVREGCSVAEPLKAGELVVIDTDYVFYESERNKRPNFMIEWAIEFYERYKIEHPEKYDQNGERKANTITLSNSDGDNKGQADGENPPAETGHDIENR